MNERWDLWFWGELFGALTLQAGCAVTATAAVCVFVKSAPWRRTVWQVCVVSLLLLTLAELTGAGRGLTVWAAARLGSASEAAASGAAGEAVERTVQVSSREAPAGEAGRSGGGGSQSAQIPLWPAVVWLAGFMAVLLRVMVARFLCLVIVWRKPGVPGSLVRTVSSLARAIGMHRRVRLLRSGGLAGPIAFGIWRPTILLPDHFEQEWRPAQREAILAHELAHLANRDPSWCLLADVAVALQWWNPLVWWARRQLHVASELCADEASSVAANGPEALAESLVELGKRLGRTRAFGGLGVIGGGFRSNLGKRVDHLLRERAPSWKRVGWRRRAGAGCAGAALLLSFSLGGGALVHADAYRSANASFLDSIRSSWDRSPSGRALSLSSDPVKSGATGMPAGRPVLMERDEGGNATAADSPRQVEIATTFIEAGDAEVLKEWLSAAGIQWITGEAAVEFSEHFKPERPGRSVSQVSGLTGTLSASGLDGLLRRVRETDGTDVLSAPVVTVLEGRQGRLAVQQEIEETPVGVQVDVTPFARKGQPGVSLSLTASVTEFLGYHENAGTTISRFRDRQVVMEGFPVPAGRTVVLTGFTEAAGATLGADAAKHLFIFVTPSVVDDSAPQHHRILARPLLDSSGDAGSP